MVSIEEISQRVEWVKGLTIVAIAVVILSTLFVVFFYRQFYELQWVIPIFFIILFGSLLLLLLLILKKIDGKVTRQNVELVRAKEQLEKYSKNLQFEVKKRTKELNKSNQELKEVNERLKSTDKMRQDFIAMVTHQLKNPLTPIHGYAEILLSEKFGKLNDKQKEAIEVIGKNEEQLHQLIDRILHVSRLESDGRLFHFRKIRLESIIEESVKELNDFAKEKNILLNLRISKKLPTIYGDREELKEVLNNLIHNAIKFTPETGKVMVKAEKKGKEIVVSIKDTGIGIPKAELKNIFQKFHRASASTDGEIQGTGLGLSICKTIIEAHKGKIWAESELGLGSSFYFSLPIKK